MRASITFPGCSRVPTTEEGNAAIKRHFEDVARRKASHRAFVATLPPYNPDMRVRCPLKNSDGTDIAPDDVRGCGSDNVSWDGFECYDCHACGIFFAPYAAEPPHQRIRDPEVVMFEDIRKSIEARGGRCDVMHVTSSRDLAAAVHGDLTEEELQRYAAELTVVVVPFRDDTEISPGGVIVIDEPVRESP